MPMRSSTFQAVADGIQLLGFDPAALVEWQGCWVERPPAGRRAVEDHAKYVAPAEQPTD